MMRILLATAALSATTLLACATQTTSSGPGGGDSGGTGGATTTTTTTDSSGGSGGTGATGGTGGTGGMTTSSSTDTTTTTTTENLCGNGVKDPGEQCDAGDFGGKTCLSIGFSGGQLKCNLFCAIVASACIPSEDCNNAEDDDQDGLTDCADPDCSQAPSCLDSCAEPTMVTLPSFQSGDTTGRPAIQSSSCSAAAGPEQVFQLVASDDVDVIVSATNFNGADITVSARTACNDPASEIHCENKQGPNKPDAETFVLHLTKGQTYFILVDGTTADDFGPFDVSFDIPLPESDLDCDDHFDNDADGFLDCDDPTDCQASMFCTPGPGAPGEACFASSDCAATGNDPICLGTQEGFADGYCSEFCDINAPVCAGDGVCVDPVSVLGIQISVHGICLDTCSSVADCRPSYDCVDRGLAKKVCLVAPESTCDDLEDNDLDQLIDCQDPDCQQGPSCVPGAKAVGQPCALNTDCFANKNDPICLTSGGFFFPGGYCSQFCDIQADDCGGGAICSDSFVNIQAPVCLDTCNGNAECRPGYTCQDIGLNKKACVF